MKIVSLSISNLMRISAVEIVPKGNVIKITGKNAQGKTSVLDAIAFALGGAKLVCPKPIKEGESKAEVKIVLTDYIVRRWWTANNKSYLQVSAHDGAVYTSGQSLLDKLRGNLSFDPFEFARMDAKKQRSVLLGIVNLEIDLEKNASDRKKLFDERTVVNRNIKESQARLSGLPIHEKDKVEKEISVSLLSNEITEANNVNNENREKREYLKNTKESVKDIETDIACLADQIYKKKEALAKKKEIVKRGEIVVADLKDIDTKEIIQQIESAEETNKSIRKKKEEMRQRENGEDEVKRFTKQADLLTSGITNLDKEKDQALGKAIFPIDKLSVDEKIVLYNNIPFSQASSAEKCKVSLSIAMALNPTIKVIRVSNGSLLDKSNMAIIENMAKDKDFQVWIEKVTDGEKIGIVIEDGMVKE